MLSNRNILCISVPAWSGNYAATIVELMKVFGRSNRVLYVQNPYTWKDFLSALIGRNKFPYRAALGIGPRVTEIRTPGSGHHGDGGTVYVMIPPVLLPINFLPAGPVYDYLLRINGWILRRAITRELGRLNMRDNLVNITAFNPALGLVTGRRFGEKLLIYHCYDEISHAPWMKKHGTAAEKTFMSLADATIVTSRGLLETKGLVSGNCFLVRNAADIGLFSTAWHSGVPPIPVIGFIGSLDSRIDYDLLAGIASSMPGTKLRLIGRIVDEKSVARLKSFNNVEVPGSKPLPELPAFVRNFSAGIIPFVKNEFTKGIYPLKINEYLAAGIPVVSTDFSYLDEFAGVISIGGNHEEFTRLLQTELETDNVQKKEKRREAASMNTWESRAEEISGIIGRLEEQNQQHGRK